eukprot:TRINITY_DN39602_c0_g1_i1.p1 TRINITY_DN39602_c0_g1~~TRINITY_DN39602_c0_g1_i1.p1  ORF type:complete len:335 (+),score=156.93 TRINITY_DN39602_c0_g1_i1:123-1007(+)
MQFGGGFSDFSRDKMKTFERRALDTLDNKSDNKFTVMRPADRQEKADKKIQGVLNKLTPEKYRANWDALVALVMEYNDLDLIERIVPFIFEKAIAEPNFSDLYADFCKDLSELSNSLSNPMGLPTDAQTKRKSPFRKALLNRCQYEFERKKECEDDQAEYRMRMRAVGAIKFIGELFMRDLVVEKIMHSCIMKLLGLTHNNGKQVPEPEEIEMLCKLMFTVGKELDHAQAAQHIDLYFARIQQLSEVTESSRLRFMLKDVVELRMRRWTERRCQQVKTKKAHKLADDEYQFARR